jgi:hypothetical protein
MVLKACGMVPSSALSQVSSGLPFRRSPRALRLLQAGRAQRRAGLEAASQPFAMVGRMELPEAAAAAGGGAGPDVYVLAAANAVQEAVAAKRARPYTRGMAPIT